MLDKTEFQFRDRTSTRNLIIILIQTIILQRISTRGDIADVNVNSLGERGTVRW